MGEAIAITSGKGGVGKSSVCINMGMVLAQKGYRVCLIDVDLGLKNLDVMLGLENRVIYDLKDDFPIVNAIIPPAGDSTRFSFTWIKEIRKGIDDIIKKSTSKDEMILFGLSYWHVDRNEIDEILLSMDASMEVKYVDPNPPTSLDAVLSSLFKNYIHYSSGNLLKE